MTRDDDLVYRLIEELEAHHLDRYEYILSDFVEADALKLLLDHAPPETNVSFQVRDLWVTVYGDGTIDVQP